MKFSRMLKSYEEVKSDKATGAARDYILIVRRDPVESALFKRNLENLGHRVKDVENGLEALRIIEKNPPALIISDIMLEGMKGHELCRTIKNNPETSNIPFMFISAPESTPDKLLGFQGYGDDYITTPFDLSVLKNRVESLIRRSRKQAVVESPPTVTPSERIENLAMLETLEDISRRKEYQKGKPSETHTVPPKFIPADDGVEIEKPPETAEAEIPRDIGRPEGAAAALPLKEIKGIAVKPSVEMAAAAGEDWEEIAVDLDFPPLKKVYEADTAQFYNLGILIIAAVEAVGGKFGPKEYRYLLKFTERVTARDLENNSLLAFALSRDPKPNLATHSLNSAIIALRIARNLNFSSNEMPLLGVAALLFDLGMLKVPPEIIYKKSELTYFEREEMKFTKETPEIDEPSREEDCAHFQVDVPEPPVGIGAAGGAGHDLIAVTGRGNGRGDPSHHHQRCHDESPAHAE